MLNHARIVFAVFVIAGTLAPALAEVQGRRPHRTANSERYRHIGAKPGRGHAGSVALEARALLALDGTMLVEASTGDVESGEGPGQISKVRINYGHVTKNFNHLDDGGYWSGTLRAAPYGTLVHVQANVRGAGRRGTTVVEASTRALRRPDLAIDAVTAPAEQAPHALVLFVAEVSEKNGDVGARANCVLSIDGVPSDAAEGIWVDAGDSVSCQFARVFEEPGTYIVGVSAASAAPADWNTANNTATTTITIAEPGQPISTGSMDAEYKNAESYSNLLRSDGVTLSESRQNWDKSYAAMSGRESGFSAALLQQIDATLYVNGALHHTVTLAPTRTTTYDDGFEFSTCAEYTFDYWDGTRQVRSSDRGAMCASGDHGDPSSFQTTYQYQRVRGSVTYYAREWYCDAEACGYYVSNSHEVWGAGASDAWTPGTAIRLQVRFLDTAGRTHTADRTVTLEDLSDQVNRSREDTWQESGFTYVYRTDISGSLFAGRTSWHE